MRRYGLDVLVATSPANITYFSDYYCWLDSLFKQYMMVPGATSNLNQAFAVFPLEGEPALVVTLSPLFAVNAADSWIEDIHIFGDNPLDESLPPGQMSDQAGRFHGVVREPTGSSTPTDALLSIFDSRGLAGARIGLEAEGLTPETHEAISIALPSASIRDCTNLLRLIRMVKSSEEMDRLSAAAEISEQAGMESLAMARPGRPVSDMVAHYRARVAEMGADFEHFLYGMHGVGIGAEPEYVLSEGEALYVDFGCIYQHYFSDTGTTLAMSELSEPLSSRYRAVGDCMAAGVELIRPGVLSSAVREAMWEALTDGGVSVSYPHGHGLGVEIRDYPIIVPDNGLRIRDDCVDVASDLPLEEDMVINLEVGVFMPGVGSLQNEQSFVVTPDGSRQLVPQLRARPVVPSEVAV